ncbi:MAG: universal stress protein [bacterium]|nr:universal stress protein [bacterium]
MCTFALSDHADMLIIGTHGKGLTEHTFMGDVAHKVLKRIRVPTISVPAVKFPGGADAA